MDGTVESTITKASVGTTAWQEAIDHGFFIMWDLAMGGNYPNGICDCTTPTPTGQITGINSLCLTNQNSLNTESNPMFVSACNGSAGQQWATYTDNTVRTEGGALTWSVPAPPAAPTWTGIHVTAPRHRTGPINQTGNW